MVYFRWGYRYPCFLKILKDLFQHNSMHCKIFLDEFGDMHDVINVFGTQNGISKKLELKLEYHDVKQMFPKVMCGLPDGQYRVEGAFHEDGKPYFITVENGGFDDKDMAIAGAYMWWCTQSNNPTGHTTLHLGCGDDYSYYHEGLCGELYHCHNVVDRVEFDLDKKSVTLETIMCR